MLKKYNQYDIKKIKESVNAYDFYLSEQNLCNQSFCRSGYRSGKLVEAGLCPFHSDSSTGSFKVNLDTGTFICFSCGAKGDIITYTERKYQLPFPQALEKLATDWRIQC